jgi:hypothetical protein
LSEFKFNAWHLPFLHASLLKNPFWLIVKKKYLYRHLVLYFIPLTDLPTLQVF